MRSGKKTKYLVFFSILSILFLAFISYFILHLFFYEGKKVAIQKLNVSEIHFREMSFQEALRSKVPPTLYQKYDAHKLLPLALGNEPRFQSRMEGQQEFYKNSESMIGIEITQKQFTPLEGTSISPHPDAPMRAYFGLLHAHTSDSDAIGFPIEAFEMGRDLAGLDFMAVTDHPEFWMFKRKNAFADCRSEAKKISTKNFIALCGFEYSNFFEGHYVVLNTPHWTSANDETTIEQFYDWLALPENKNAIVFFAHPGYHIQRRKWDFKKFKFDPRLVDIITGEEVIHRNMWRAYAKGFSGKKPFIDETINKGWKVGAIAAQDNHKKSWGIQNSSRIGLLMSGLSEENIFAALKNRRYYATHAEGLQLSVDLLTKKGQWIPMGSEISRTNLDPKNALVRARFALAEYQEHFIREFQVISDGEVVKSFALADRNNIGAGEFEFKLELPLPQKGMTYFYIRMFHHGHPEYVTQSSPIFIN